MGARRTQEMTLPRSNLRPDEPSKINSQDYVFILDSAISKQRTQGLPSIDRRYIEAMDFFWFLSIAYEVVLLQLTQFLRSFNLITTYFLLETYCSPFFIFFCYSVLNLVVFFSFYFYKLQFHYYNKEYFAIRPLRESLHYYF